MLFRSIRDRLIWSYLIVLTVILGSFAIAVRIIFIHSLTRELTEQLMTIAQSSTVDLETEQGKLIVTDDEVPLNNSQALQWFDLQGHLIHQQGHFVVTIPFNPTINPTIIVQSITTPISIQSVTIPIFKEGTKQLIGYVRASELTTTLNHTIQRLDWGLAIGIILALLLSSIGGLWLTNQAMQPIDLSFRKLQRFTADASHELRSPLMAIKSNATVALKYAEGMRPLDAEKFQAIASATVQMSALTEDLLMLARTDQIRPNKLEIINLKSLLEELTQIYKSQAEIKQIHWQVVQFDALEILGDRPQLMRLLTNLLDNALRYTPALGTIKIEVNCRKKEVFLAIKDTGIGIAEDQLDCIFDRFWRADQARSYGENGFGLGLAIAQGIAQLHGGKIIVTSELGVGSCFTVRLPLYQKPIIFWEKS